MQSVKFDELLDADLARRKKEISELLLLAKSNIKNKAIAKSLILLIYAHWEGFIKRSSKLYLQLISKQEVSVSELEKNFQAISLKKCFAHYVNTISSSSIESEIKLFEQISRNSEKKFKINIDMRHGQGKSIIDTNSNLNYAIFKRIHTVIGLNFHGEFDIKSSFLDNKLLKNRNIIAHGDFIEDGQDKLILDIQEIEKLKDFIYLLMDSFKEQISDYFFNDFYLITKLEKKNEYDQAFKRIAEAKVNKLIQC